jgi:hypothetical protein
MNKSHLGFASLCANAGLDKRDTAKAINRPTATWPFRSLEQSDIPSSNDLRAAQRLGAPGHAKKHTAGLEA